MRRILAFILLLSILSPLQAEEPLTITRVWSGYREAKSFKRISEYFSGKENTGGQLIVRSQPENRAGFYFTIRAQASNTSSFPLSKVRLEVITPETPTAKTFDFTVPPIDKTNALLLLGLTGSDWPKPEDHPVAWKFSFFNTKEEIIAEEKSYLWELPSTDN